VLHVLAYLGESLSPHITPKNALQAQLALMPYVSRQLGGSAEYRRIILPFLRAYWSRMMSRAWYEADDPQAVADRLRKIADLPTSEQARSILGIFVRGLKLDVGLPTEYWLAGTDDVSR
jgi:hypothetical protein